MVAQTTPAAPAAGKIVGIIYPPPEVRNIVDKTAQYVAKNGADFLTRIQANEASNPKFSFLKEGDPYHAYFLMKVNEGPEDGEKPAADLQVKPVAAVAAAPVEETKPLEPPPEFHFSATVPTISAQDIDTVKLTAQFVAQNGKQFLTSLMQKEGMNYHFDFLKPQHSLFHYFTKLVEQYTKVLVPQKGVKEELARAADDKFYSYARIQHRLQWALMERERKKREDDVAEKERIAFQQIDWHDFVIVETIPFSEHDSSDLPPPVNIKTLLARVIEQERYDSARKTEKAARMDPEEQAMLAEAAAAARKEAAGGADNDDVDMEVEDVDMDMGSPEPLPAPLEPIQPSQVIVRDYDPKQKQKEKGGAMYQNCPNCGQSILASELAEHIRIELLDPRWREQKERLERERAAGQTVYSSVDAMEKTLKHIANYRTDIFNTDESEAAKKVAEDQQRSAQKVMWDGHSGSANTAQKKAQDNIRPEDLKPAPRPDPIGPRGPTPGQRQQMQHQQQQQYPMGGPPPYMQQFPPGMGPPPGMHPMMGMPMPGMMQGMPPPGFMPGMMPPPPPPGGPPPQQPMDGSQPKRPRLDGQ